MRSRITQKWIFEATGIEYPLVEGGYKALRNYLIQTLETVDEWICPIRIGGRTGVGKTELLKKIKHHIDLEGLAMHKGSSFGRLIDPQPTQINFENALAIKLIQHRENGNPPVFLENEAHNIGRVYIPQKTYEVFNSGPLLVLEATSDERTEFTFREYITEELKKYQTRFGKEKGFELWRESIESSFHRIEKRLGGLRYKTLCAEIEEAMNEHLTRGKSEAHKPWIKTLLVEYYDSMYDYHTAKSNNQIEFQGDVKALMAYIDQKYSA